MTPQPIRRIIDASDAYYGSLRLAENDTHRDAKEFLRARAEAEGFQQGFSQWDNSEPDCLAFRHHDRTLLIADAKDSANETPGKRATAERIASYLQTGNQLLKRKAVDALVVKIATDKLDAAQRWVQFLNGAADFFGWGNAEGQPYEFSVTQEGGFYVVG